MAAMPPPPTRSAGDSVATVASVSAEDPNRFGSPKFREQRKSARIMLNAARPSMDEEQCVITGEDAEEDGEEGVEEEEESGQSRSSGGNIHPRTQGHGWLHAATTEELQEMIKVKGGEWLLRRRTSLAYDRAALRVVLTDLIKNGAHDPDRFLPDRLVESWMRGVADNWPSDEIDPPQNTFQALDLDGPWGPTARGVEIRQCTAVIEKGMGAFATRGIPRDAVIGVYWGELLVQREFNLRHGWKVSSGGSHVEVSVSEEAALTKRRRRLGALEPGRAPIGGIENGGSYCFALLPEEYDYSEERIAFIDAEDPNRSAWSRYINHANGESGECNCVSMVDAASSRVWFRAFRDILPGEEICFSYQGEMGEPLLVPFDLVS